jgi:hypothetical protein
MAVASPPSDDASAQPVALPPVTAADRSWPRRVWATSSYPLMVWAWSRLLTFGAVAMVSWINRPHGSHNLAASMIYRLRSWDGVWYLQIAQHWYDPFLSHGNAPAFFPLYPGVIAVIRLVVPVSYAVIGLAASTLLFAPALVALYQLTKLRLGTVVAERTVLYLAISPLSFVFSAAYTESLALLLTVGTFLLLERRRYLQASAVGALAVLARPIGILLAPAIAWRIFDDAGRRLSWRVVAQLSAVLLLPLALVGFQAWLYWRTGHPLATLDAEARGWGRTTNPLLVAALPVAVFSGVWLFHTTHNISHAISAAAAGLYFWLIVYAWRRRALPIEYLMFAAACVILPAYEGTWLGFPRYGLCLFPVFWGLALLGANHRVDQALRMAMPAMMTGMVFIAYGAGTFTP